MSDLGVYRFEKSIGAEFYENIQNIVNLNNDVIGFKNLMRVYRIRDYTGLGFSPNDDTNYIFCILCSVDNTVQ
jgi:hypothetical protein